MHKSCVYSVHKQLSICTQISGVCGYSFVRNIHENKVSTFCTRLYTLVVHNLYTIFHMVLSTVNRGDSGLIPTIHRAYY